MTKSERQDNDPKDFEGHKRRTPHEDLEAVAFDDGRPDRVFRIGTRLGEEHRRALVALIRRYEEVFAWGPEDMPGMDQDIALHKLHIDPSFKPVKKKKINFLDDKNRAIQKEVEELVATKAMRELQFPEWIVNVVMAQVLADFIVENNTRSTNEAPSQEKILEEAPKWTLYVDEVSNDKGTGARILIQGANGEQ
ncbi:hypothetical protein LIER_20228 [Lithospermum erythrorhizon]|uniref:Uncharacterized protein n=1 Tax=Lithospermum erythrorhizon TaxID=34254 RepID=A0AAV3QN89_LITER